MGRSYAWQLLDHCSLSIFWDLINTCLFPLLKFLDVTFIWRINEWFWDWYCSQGFGYLNHGTCFEKPGGWMGSTCQRKGRVSLVQASQPGEEGFKLYLLGWGNLSPSHSYQFNASASRRCLEGDHSKGVSRIAPEEQQKGPPAGKPASSGA